MIRNVPEMIVAMNIEAQRNPGNIYLPYEMFFLNKSNNNIFLIFLHIENESCKLSKTPCEIIPISQASYIQIEATEITRIENTV